MGVSTTTAAIIVVASIAAASIHNSIAQSLSDITQYLAETQVPNVVTAPPPR